MTFFRKSFGLFTVGCAALMLLVAIVTPANASKRMVLAEEMSNTY